jgi:hypothetical protein
MELEPPPAWRKCHRGSSRTHPERIARAIPNSNDPGMYAREYPSAGIYHMKHYDYIDEAAGG